MGKMIEKDEKGMIEIITPKINENLIDSIAETNRVIADALCKLIDSNKELTNALGVQPCINISNVHIETKDSASIGIKIGQEQDKEEVEQFWFDDEDYDEYFGRKILFDQREFR